MIVLTIDGSNHYLEIGVYDTRSQKLINSYRSQGQYGESENLASFLLGEFGSDVLDAVSGVAINLGPGSFTGLRSTIAFAQGVVSARPDFFVRGVSLFAICAYKFLREHAMNENGLFLYKRANADEFFCMKYVADQDKTTSNKIEVVTEIELEEIKKNSKLINIDCGEISYDAFDLAQCSQLQNSKEDFPLKSTLLLEFFSLDRLVNISEIANLSPLYIKAPSIGR